MHKQQIQQNITVTMHNVFPHISSIARAHLIITDQDHLLEVLYVNIRHVYENTLLQQMIMIRIKWEKQ